MRTLAFVFPDGRLCVDTQLTREEQLWRIYLGWPDEDEIKEAKLKGHKVVEIEFDIKEILK